MNLGHGHRCIIYTAISGVALLCGLQEVSYHGYVQAVLYALLFVYCEVNFQKALGLWKLTPRRSFTIYGKDGWAVERIIGRPFTNFVRLLIHGDVAVTWRNWRRNRRPSPSSDDDTTLTFMVR